MGNTFTEKIGYGNRVKNSFKGVLVGIVLIIVGVGLLWWNEGRTVKEYIAIKEVGENAVSVGIEKIDPQNENKLVHIQGPVNSDKGVEDTIFKVKSNDLGLIRTVEMFQWKEKSSKNSNGDTKTYTYEKEWSEREIDSSFFKKKGEHINPKMSYNSNSVYAKDATIKAFSISPNQVSKVRTYEPIAIPTESLKGFPTTFQGGSIAGNILYSGSINAPEIGDYRVTFEKIPNNSDATLVAQQSRNNLQPYLSSNKRTIEIVYPGLHSLEGVIALAQRDNSMLGWIIRAGGLMALVVGFSLLLGPIQAIASIVPFLGSMTTHINGFIGGALGLSLGITVIAVSWIFYRPLIGIALLLGVLGILYLIKKKNQKNASLAQSVETPAPPSTQTIRRHL